MAEHADRAEHAGEHRQHDHEHGLHKDEAGLAELLDLDADVLGSYLREVTGWAQELAPDAPRTVVDLGAGTGSGSLALARRFSTAQVIAVDVSEAMLERVGAAALANGLGERMRLVRADLNEGWPPVGPVDLAWASSSVHELYDPDRMFRDVFAALNPGGLMIVVELDTLPRFLPDDVGRGRPGLETRAHELLAKAGWNSHQDWRPHLTRAGFEIAGQRSFSGELTAGQAAGHVGASAVTRYAHAYLRRVRLVLDEQLGADDLETLDAILADDGPDAIVNRADLTLRTTRTAWAGRRP
jgi:SAM-dependent methyltransferase